MECKPIELRWNEILILTDGSFRFINSDKKSLHSFKHSFVGVSCIAKLSKRLVAIGSRELSLIKFYNKKGDMNIAKVI